MAKKICAALKFAADATDALILNTCLKVWCERNLNEDNTLKPNNYAPIYLVRGDRKESVRRVGQTLALFVEKASIPLPTQKVTMVMPEPLEEPKPKAPAKRKRNKKAKK